MQFGQIKRITTPLGQAGQLRGIAFIQYKDSFGYDKCLQYQAKLDEMKTVKYVKPVTNNAVQEQNPLKMTQEQKDKVAQQSKQTQAVLNDIQLGTGETDHIMQQVNQQRELNGFDQIKHDTDPRFKELDQIRQFSHRMVDLDLGSFKLFDNSMKAYQFKKGFQLRKEHESQMGDDNNRHLELLKYGLKIPGRADYKDYKIQKQDEEFRVRAYHKQKHLLENVNFHVNPLRVEIRNFNKHLTEEQLLISLWTYLTNQKDLLEQNR